MVDRRGALFGLTVCAAALLGCAYIQAQNARHRWEQRLEPMKRKGTSMQVVFEKFGPPDHESSHGNATIWIYRVHHGTRSSGSARSTNYGNQTVASGSSQSWEQYDRVRILFKNKRVSSYSIHVQR